MYESTAASVNGEVLFLSDVVREGCFYRCAAMPGSDPEVLTLREARDRLIADVLVLQEQKKLALGQVDNATLSAYAGEAVARMREAFAQAAILLKTSVAERLDDGRDFVPTNRWVLLGHHFAAIAGPGPLVGPTLAAQFGYLPGTLWILVGAALGGCVQDMVTLFFSTRRNGRSLGQMARDELGAIGGVAALIATHNFEIARRMDRVVTLEGGQLEDRHHALADGELERILGGRNGRQSQRQQRREGADPT